MGEGMWNATTHLGSSCFYNNTNSSMVVGMKINQYFDETHVGGSHELTFISNNRTYPLPYTYDKSTPIKTYKDAGNIWWELNLSLEKRNYKPTDVINLHLDLWAMSSSTEYLIPKKYTPLEMVDEVNGLNTELGEKFKARIQGEKRYVITAEDLEGINRINQYSFYNSTITDLELPNTITTIGP
jgi:hypothetical protein